VSWCPLGFDGRPVFAFYGFGRSFTGWTVLPRGNFGAHRYYANRYGVDPRRLPTNAAFVQHNRAPRADRIGRANVNNAPSVGVAVPRRQPPAQARRHLPQARRETFGALQSTTAVPRQLHRAIRFHPPRTRDRQPARWRNRRRWRVRVCRCITASRRARRLRLRHRQPDSGARPDAGCGPDSLNSGHDPTPGYRSPGEYRIQRMEPRVAPSPGVRAGRAFLPCA
jgi:hypothetical protein